MKSAVRSIKEEDGAMYDRMRQVMGDEEGNYVFPFFGCMQVIQKA